MSSYNKFIPIYKQKQSNGDFWNDIQSHTKYLTDWGKGILSRGFSSDDLKMIIIEPEYLCKDHRNLFSNFYSKKYRVSSPLCNRIHFFNQEISDLKEVLLDNTEKFNNNYIGYSIIRPVFNRCLGRTVIDPKKAGMITGNKKYWLRTEFRQLLGTNSLVVEGYPYIAQDTDVNVCAHAALWGVCRYLSERYSVYKEMYPFDLVNLTGTSLGRPFPFRGMSYTDYCSILSDFGSYPVLLKLKEREKNRFKFNPGSIFGIMCIY